MAVGLARSRRSARGGLPFLVRVFDSAGRPYNFRTPDFVDAIIQRGRKEMEVRRSHSMDLVCVHGNKMK